MMTRDKLPDFRNVLTTGNVVSVLSMAFICGMAWMNVQASQSYTIDRVVRLENNDAKMTIDVQLIKQGVATINANQLNQNRSIEEIKEQLKTITRQTK